MKKLLSLLLAVLYMTTSSGVVLNVHYCMGKVSSVEVENFRSTFCKCGKQQADPSCCKTEIRVCKLANAHKAAVLSCKVEVPDAEIIPSYLLTKYNEVTNTSAVHPSGNAPPGLTARLYLQNCVLRV